MQTQIKQLKFQTAMPLTKVYCSNNVEDKNLLEEHNINVIKQLLKLLLKLLPFNDDYKLTCVSDVPLGEKSTPMTEWAAQKL